MYPSEFPLDWTNYHHRKSLVRVIKQLEKMAIISTVEGEIDQFALHEEHEVLYEVSIYARYFMRSYPKDLFEYDSMDEILQSEWARHEEGARRKRVYRKLVISPVVYRDGEDDPDFAYIRNFRNRLRDDLEAHTLFRFEVFKNAALLVTDENKQELSLFPDQKAIMDVALHVAAYLRENIDQYPPDALGTIRLTDVTLEQIITEAHQIYGSGWSKQYREASIQSTKREFVALLENWEMLEQEPITNVYIVKPLLGRFFGMYPSNFDAEEGRVHDEAT